jgi:plastocyanin
MTRTSICCLTAFVALTWACGGSQPPPPAPVPAGKTVDAATAGSIGGRVSFAGPAPLRATLKVDADPACVTHAGPNPQSDATLVGADGSLQNAFVWIKEGLDPAYSFAVPAEPVLLDQKGCVYTPRVIGIRTGQALEVVNNDATLHNVHALPRINQEFNFGQPIQGRRDRKTFTAPEVMVRFMCNVHNWMAAYVGVVAHPFHAVTDASGAFELKGVPPGTYTVEAWHEKLGTRTASVTVGASQAQKSDFTFTPTETEKD